MYRITTNVCLDELRRRKRRPPTVELVVEAGPGGGRLHDSTVVDRMTVDDALARLPEEYRAAVVLRDLCDLEYAEIAEALEIPPARSAPASRAGRAQLAELLGGNQTDPGERRSEVP